MIHINCLLSMLTLFLGCTSHYHYTIPKTSTVQEIPSKFKKLVVIEEDLVFEEKLVSKENNYNLYDISILHQGKELTALRWYSSKKTTTSKKPVDFIWPILAGKRMIVANLYAANIYAPIGLDSIIIRQKEKLFSRKPLRQIEEFTPFHQETVRHMMRAIRWAKQKKIFDQKRFGMTGTSYGGILTSVCLAFTSDFVSHKIVMGGGGVASILSKSKERGVSRWRKATLDTFTDKIRSERTPELKALYYDDTQKYEKQFAKEAKKLFAVKTKTLYKWDPYLFAKYADSKKIAMIVTLCDTVVPTENQIALWKKLRKPETLFVRTGHYTLALAYFQVKSFLGKMATKHYNLK